MLDETQIEDIRQSGLEALQEHLSPNAESILRAVSICRNLTILLYDLDAENLSESSEELESIVQELDDIYANFAEPAVSHESLVNLCRIHRAVAINTLNALK